jgi:translation initiation factor 2 alpha subunit (eIF-2alpha)
VVYNRLGKKITEEQKLVLREAIAKKMAPTPVKLRAGFELNCFTYEGIDAIKEALLAAKAAVNEEKFIVDVIITLILVDNFI